MNTSRSDTHPLVLPDDERPDVVALAQLLANDHDRPPSVVVPDGSGVSLSGVIIDLLQDVTRKLIAGEAINIVSIPHELNVAQTADFLDERIDEVQSLIDDGLLVPIDGTSPPRLRLVDLIAFREAEDLQRDAALDELLRISQEVGAYSSRS